MVRSMNVDIEKDGENKEKNLTPVIKAASKSNL